MRHLFLSSMFMFTVTTFSPMASAYKIIGNGAMVVVCDPSTGEAPVRLLDTYETEDIYSAPFLPPLTLSNPQGADYVTKFHYLVARISERFPDLSRQILEEFANFEAHASYKKNKKLPGTDDDFHSDLPIGCELKQLVVQREPMFLRRPWFTVAAEYWDQMDEFNKAATVLHETLYRIGINNGLEHSLGIRYLVGLLISNEIQSVSDQDWIDAFTQSRIRNFEIGSLKIPLFSGEFVPCRPSPGTVGCTRTESLKVANLRYSPERRLEQVNYAKEETVNFTTAGDVKGKWQVKEMRFIWSGHSVDLIGDGDISLRNPSTQVNLNFRGLLQLAEGTLKGIQRLQQAHDVEGVNFDESALQILSKYGDLQLGPGLVPTVKVRVLENTYYVGGATTGNSAPLELR